MVSRFDSQRSTTTWACSTRSHTSPLATSARMSARPDWTWCRQASSAIGGARVPGGAPAHASDDHRRCARQRAAGGYWQPSAGRVGQRSRRSWGAASLPQTRHCRGPDQSPGSRRVAARHAHDLPDRRATRRLAAFTRASVLFGLPRRAPPSPRRIATSPTADCAWHQTCGSKGTCLEPQRITASPARRDRVAATAPQTRPPPRRPDARPLLHQRGMELQRYGTISPLPNGLDPRSPRKLPRT